MPHAQQKEGLIKVIVVDDSVVVRSFLTKFLEEDSMISVTHFAQDGQKALDIIKEHQFEVVILDIEMPVMDGLTALPKILQLDPNLHVLMASTLTQRNAKITLEALKMGASECLAKPTSSGSLSNTHEFKRDLVEKTKTLGKLTHQKRLNLHATPVPGAIKTSKPLNIKEFKLSTKKELPIAEAIAIGSSTGGPKALLDFFKGLKGIKISKPIFITQHMPANFTAILAENISNVSGHPCAEGKDGEKANAGTIYLAPGGYHMTVERKEFDFIIKLNQGPAENFCRPSVEPMLRSITEAYSGKVLTVILTGMGSDGANACEALTKVGGTVFAQDEETSVVWGMPRAVAFKGICNRVESLTDLIESVKSYI